MTEIQEKKLKAQIEAHLQMLVNGVLADKNQKQCEIEITGDDLFTLFKVRLSEGHPGFVNKIAYDNYLTHINDHEHVVLDKSVYERLLESETHRLIDKMAETVGGPIKSNLCDTCTLSLSCDKMQNYGTKVTRCAYYRSRPPAKDLHPDSSFNPANAHNTLEDLAYLESVHNTVGLSESGYKRLIKLRSLLRNR